MPTLAENAVVQPGRGLENKVAVVAAASVDEAGPTPRYDKTCHLCPTSSFAC